jgi:hypothetical protein
MDERSEAKIARQKIVNFDFQNLTIKILDQKGSNLCVPISLSVLLQWAIKNYLNVKDEDMEDYLTVEKILTQLTMIIYPRRLAGMNLNPKKEQKKFQLRVALKNNEIRNLSKQKWMGHYSK